MNRWFVGIAMAFVAACSVDESGNPAYCESQAACEAGLVCYRHLCVIAGDAGAVDTGTDTGPTDTGSADTGSVDTGPMDTGPVDTGADTRPADTGPMCPADRVCEGDCCLTSETCCGDGSGGARTCVNLLSDGRHCGTCGNVCGVTSCIDGVCL